MELLFAHEYQQALRRERVFRDQLDLLHVCDQELISKYRFPRHEIINIIHELEPLLQRQTLRSHAITVCTQIMATLRFLASGSFQNVVGDISGLSQPSVSNIITSVTNALAEKSLNEVKMPAGVIERQQTMRDFHALGGFPRVIGAIDGSRIPIKAPVDDEAIFVNRKKFHSMNIQVVCDANKRIINFNVSNPGSTHDSYIWSNCELRARFQRGEFGDGLLLAEQEYNRRHTRTRVIIEQVFGVLKSRFRCLHKSGGNLQYKPSKCAKIIAACLLLHNRCILMNIPNPDDYEEDEVYMEPEERGHDGAQRVLGRQVRDLLVHNFF
ncbi:putative nuclease HARBI1 isoform X2 [Hyalella azteca]|uniref:Putative nuclease HARBI1 n=1 Tax=Hyalella azteca TaxID=294128 RepID=A0A8B7PLC8_HYAAZ|nr:putative nuclease HARBI1 isoform X2 [Hyalella azteca]